MNTIITICAAKPQLETCFAAIPIYPSSPNIVTNKNNDTKAHTLIRIWFRLFTLICINFRFRFVFGDSIPTTFDTFGERGIDESILYTYIYIYI